MKRFAALFSMILMAPAVAVAEVTVLSDNAAAEVRQTPDRVFPCEALPWADPGSSLPDLVFYDVRGVTGSIRLDRSGGTIEISADEPQPATPASGGPLEAEARWGDVAFQSGTAIGRALTVQPASVLALHDADGSAGQYFRYDEDTLALETDDLQCLEADESGARAVPCTGSPRQEWIVDVEGRLRANTCEGEWACLVTPGLQDGALPRLETCQAGGPRPEESWAVARWNEPVNVDSLLAGQGTIEIPLDYFAVVAVEGSAVPVVPGPSGRPIVAAATAGAGRAVAFGANGSVCATSSDGSYETLLRKLLEWAGGNSAPVIGLSPQSTYRRDCFQQQGFTTVDANPGALAGVDVYVMEAGDDGAAPADVAALEAFLRGGGGLVASHYPFVYWEIQQFPPTDNLLARVFSEAGLAWAEDVFVTAAPATSLVDVSGGAPAMQDYQITAAFEAFVRHQLGIETLTTTELESMEANLPVAITARVRLTDVSPFTVAQRALERTHGPLLIGPSQPFTWGDPLKDMTLRGAYLLAEALPPDRTRAHESAALFPGLVAPEAPRLTRTVTIDGNLGAETRPTWRSTGLYAPPGEVVTVRFPASAVGQGWFLQFGASFDNPIQHVGWLEPETFGRFPWVTAGRLVQFEEIELASAFGGPIIIQIPSGSTLGPVDVEVAGAVEIPEMVLDSSGGSTWRGDFEAVPLAELQAENVIVTVRSSVVDAITDPVFGLQQLDALIAAEADLVGIEDDHCAVHPFCLEVLPQRLVFDPHEAWGAHNGYPIHMTQSWDAETLDTGVWPGGSGLWGFLHEFGHNYQDAAWTLDHQWEATCNILAVYAFETVLGLPMSEAWAGNLTPTAMSERTQAWLDSGEPYHQQIYDVALYFFLYVKEAFGWEPFHTMYAEYRALPEEQRPQTEQEKIDQLAIRLSHATGRNLTAWFERFRFPLSNDVYCEVDPLPLWDSAPFGTGQPSGSCDPCLQGNQWASTAFASSEFSSTEWSAMQATGEPDSNVCADVPTSWAPLTSSADPEWLEVEYTTPIYATGVDIYETWATGGVYRIEVRDTTGTLHVVWSDTDVATCPGVLNATWPKTSFPVRAVRIHTAIEDWEGIDAVQILGSVCP